MSLKVSFQVDFIFFAFWLPKCACLVCKSRSARKDAPQTVANETKSARGYKPKEMQKSDKKSAYIPYLDNIEITLMKIFAKTTEISGKIEDLWYNRLLSVFGSTLICDRILFASHYQERFGVSLGISYDWEV